MMYQFLGGASGATSSAGGSMYAAAASTVSCTSSCPVESSARSPASATRSFSGCSSKLSCSSAISRLFCEELQDPLDTTCQQRIDHREICGEGEHAEDHDSRGALHLFAVRPGHAAHLQLQIVEIIPRVPNPNFDVGSSHKVFLSHVLPTGCGCLAGAEGFEPPLAVLETAGLPLNLRPCDAPPVQGGTPILLDFLMRLVLPAVPAELLHFQAFGGGLLVLGRRVVPVLALRALERNNVARHGSNSYLMISVTVPAPTVRPPSRIAKRNPLSMATGVISSTVKATLSPGITISVPSGNSATPVTSVVRKWNCGRYPLKNGVCRPPSSLLNTYTDPLNTVCGVIVPGLAITCPRSTSSLSTPRNSRPTLSPARPSSNSFLNISTPVTTVLRVGRNPTISISSPTLQIPRSMRPVTTVPRP